MHRSDNGCGLNCGVDGVSQVRSICDNSWEVIAAAAVRSGESR